MSTRRNRKSATEPTAGAGEAEKHVDATDEEQSSDDEAPEEVSAAAATALAGRRRKAEQQARQATATKRKRARSSSSAKGNKNASGVVAGDEPGSGAGTDDALSGLGGGGSSSELELPTDLLLKVKSGGLQRVEADLLAARQREKAAAAAAGATAALERRRAIVKAGDVPRSDNFRLVVLDEDGGDGVDEGAGSKAGAAESAKSFLRERMGSRKRVSHSLLKARKHLGPSPNF